MTNNKNAKSNNVKQASKAIRDLTAQVNALRGQTAKATSKPFRKVGGKLGGVFGPMGKNLGKMAGSALGSLFGSGDYTMPLPNPSTNSIINATQPHFVNGIRNPNSVFIPRREFIADVIVQPGGAFVNQQYPINPAQSATFPFLCGISTMFEQYYIHGMVFEFRSLASDSVSSVNAGLGSVIMATQYDVLDPPFTNKNQMENYEMSQSAKPSQSQLHGVECAAQSSTLTKLYCRPNNSTYSGDLRFYDFGTFSIATAGIPNTTAVTIGELYVTYEIELLKTKIPNTIGGNVASAHAYMSVANSSTTSASPLSGTLTVTTGTLTVTKPNNNQFNISGVTIGNKYIASVTWFGGTVANPNVTSAYTGFVAGPNGFVGNTGNTFVSPSPTAAGSTAMTFSVILTATATSGSLGFGGGGQVPANAAVDFYITALDSSVL